MGIIERLRQAEQQGRQAARRSYERARESWEDSERQLRRRMRIHPRPVEQPLRSSDAATLDDTDENAVQLRPASSENSEPEKSPAQKHHKTAA